MAPPRSNPPPPPSHQPPPRRIVLTGGPGAGKTAVLEVLRRELRGRVTVLPESASIIFGGGFPRGETPSARKAAQRAIFHVQDALERMALEEATSPLVLCDRGVVDGAAYWPDGVDDFWEDLRVRREDALARYAMVIHLQTPDLAHGYNHQNPLRTESDREARAIDQRILTAWEGHPRRVCIERTDDFFDKLRQAVALIHTQLEGHPPDAGQ
jgi:predicted ATPase